MVFNYPELKIDRKKIFVFIKTSDKTAVFSQKSSNFKRNWEKLQSWFADREWSNREKIKDVRESATGISLSYQQRIKSIERGRDWSYEQWLFIIQRRKSYMGTGTYMCIAVAEIGRNSLLIVPVFWMKVRMKGRCWRFEGEMRHLSDVFLEERKRTKITR